MRSTLYFTAKKRDTKEKRKSFKSEAIKRLSIKVLKNYQNVTVLASLERLEFKFFWSANQVGQQYFSVLHDPDILKSILPALLLGR